MAVDTSKPLVAEMALDEGAALIAQADAWYAAQGVKDPARMTALLVPGW